MKDGQTPKAPVPPAGEKRCASISGVWGESPSGCRAEPCRPPRRRGVQGQGPAGAEQRKRKKRARIQSNAVECKNL
ncbi:hypothetical protein D7X33_20595 [Butyricicoccus sp. 1XD8-22]|nr:hypothetical protein D7X33_20595 [Butyricicoccus sp. 1XD8-22]